MNTLTIQINQNDINKGIQGSTSLCPIAFAIKRLYKPEKVYVGQHFIRIDDKFYSTPIDGQTFIANFDNNLTVYPFELTLQEHIFPGAR